MRSKLQNQCMIFRIYGFWLRECLQTSSLMKYRKDKSPSKAMCKAPTIAKPLLPAGPMSRTLWWKSRKWNEEGKIDSKHLGLLTLKQEAAWDSHNLSLAGTEYTLQNYLKHWGWPLLLLCKMWVRIPQQTTWWRKILQNSPKTCLKQVKMIDLPP